MKGLSETQAELRSQFALEPESAKVHWSLPAQLGRLAEGEIFCDVITSTGAERFYLHPKVGGPQEGLGHCAAEQLLACLLACQMLSAAALAENRGERLGSDTVGMIEGDWDAGATLKIHRNAPKGITGISVAIRVEERVSPEVYKKVKGGVRSVCVVGQTLESGQPDSGEEAFEVQIKHAGHAEPVVDRDADTEILSKETIAKILRRRATAK